MNGLPETIDDLSACVVDHLDELQERMHASNTDMWEAYRTENDPREEEYFRNRLVEHLSGLMPEAIRLEPELRMPERMRADFVAIRHAMGLPVEITRFSSRVQHLAIEAYPRASRLCQTRMITAASRSIRYRNT